MAVHVDFSLSWLSSPRLPASHADRLLRLLGAISRDGSLKEAARAVGVSYRHAWGLLGEAAGVFGAPLVEMRRGRGARPTALGEKLLWADGHVRRALDPQLARLRQDVEAELSRALPQRLPRLIVHASHDLALADLARLCAGRLDLDVAFGGAEDCLEALAQGRCDLAGFHVADALPRAAAAAAALGRWLDPQRHVLIHFVTREQGLIVRPDSHIRGVHDLARPGVRFIHRQSAADAGVAGRNGHSVAALVAEGDADAAFGLRADAMRHKLEFVPLALERYFLAANRAAVRSHAGLRVLLERLKGADFARLVAQLPGYEAAKAGVHEELRAALNWVGDARRPGARRTSSS